MRIALAVLMMVHGVAHLVGFAGAWRLAPDGIPLRSRPSVSSAIDPGGRHWQSA